MIAPRTTLLWTAGLTAAPLLAIAGLSDALLWPCFAAVALLVIFAALDAIAGTRALRDISVRVPPLVRLSKDRKSAVVAALDNAGQRSQQVRLALAWPSDLEALDPEASALLSTRPGEPVGYEIGFRATRRGRYTIPSCHLLGSSPLGLWSIRQQRGIALEVRVYPNLTRDRTAAQFLRHGPGGIRLQRLLGKGREFEKLRDYVHGDSFEDVHWKATARRGRPIIKVFQVERTQEVYLVIDASRLSARGENLERFIEAALIVCLAAERQGDRFGLITFSSQVDQFLSARNGKTHFGACREAIYNLEPRPVAPDFAELFTFIQLRIRQRALIVFLTALDDPLLSENFARDVSLISGRHLVLTAMLEQPAVRRLFTGPEPSGIGQIYESLAGHLFWQKLRELEKTLHLQGVTLRFLDPKLAGGQLASAYLEVKQRQLL